MKSSKIGINILLLGVTTLRIDDSDVKRAVTSTDNMRKNNVV